MSLWTPTYRQVVADGIDTGDANTIAVPPDKYALMHADLADWHHDSNGLELGYMAEIPDLRVSAYPTSYNLFSIPSYQGLRPRRCFITLESDDGKTNAISGRIWIFWIRINGAWFVIMRREEFGSAAYGETWPAQGYLADRKKTSIDIHVPPSGDMLAFRWPKYDDPGSAVPGHAFAYYYGAQRNLPMQAAPPI